MTSIHYGYQIHHSKVNCRGGFKSIARKRRDANTIMNIQIMEDCHANAGQIEKYYQPTKKKFYLVGDDSYCPLSDEGLFKIRSQNGGNSWRKLRKRNIIQRYDSDAVEKRRDWMRNTLNDDDALKEWLKEKQILDGTYDNYEKENIKPTI